MIDYAMMKRESPKLKAKLTRAKRTGDYDKVKAACLDALRVWDKAGAWPDNWMDWNIALQDAAPNWRDAIDLDELDAMRRFGTERT